MALPLEGIRIVDLTQVMAGPFCTMMLADFGADVIKVEPPGTGDLSRRMGGAQMKLKGDDNAPFLALNRNKRSVALDLKSEADRESFYRLVETADVVIENYRPGVAQRLGIGYEQLSAIRPDLIYASISGFGQTGPYAGRPGFDLIAQGMSGVMSVTGEPGGSPVKCGIPISDLGAGMLCAMAILTAYVHRQRTGEGQCIDTSLFEAAVALSVWESTELWATGHVPEPFGSAHRLLAPYQALRARDGYLTVGGNTERQWAELCAAIGRAELVSDPRFATNADRLAHREELVAELETTLMEDSATAWVEKLLDAGVPAGPIYDYQQVFDDPHAQARALVEEMDHPVEGRVRTLGFPVKLSATPARVRRPAPLLGEHTAEILDELDATAGRAFPVSPSGDS